MIQIQIKVLNADKRIVRSILCQFYLKINHDSEAKASVVLKRVTSSVSSAR